MTLTPRVECVSALHAPEDHARGAVLGMEQAELVEQQRRHDESLPVGDEELLVQRRPAQGVTRKETPSDSRNAGEFGRLVMMLHLVERTQVRAT
jgi:hypothetical protein